MIKKILALTLVLVMLSTIFVGCSTNKEEQNTTTTTESQLDKQKVPVENSQSVTEATTLISSNQNDEIRQNYVAPTSLSDNILDCIFCLEGKFYSLPVHISEFLDNGWKIANGLENMMVQANYQRTGGISLKKNNNEISLGYKNFSDKEVSITEVVVTSVHIIEANTGLDIEFSGGIKLGTSLTNFTNKTDISKFTKDKGVVGEVEYSYFTPSNRVYITFTEEKIVAINIYKFVF